GLHFLELSAIGIPPGRRFQRVVGLLAVSGNLFDLNLIKSVLLCLGSNELRGPRVARRSLDSMKASQLVYRVPGDCAVDLLRQSYDVFVGKQRSLCELASAGLGRGGSQSGLEESRPHDD